MSEELEQNYVEILGDDGSILKCEIYDIVDFEEKTYALLLPLEETDNNEENDNSESSESTTPDKENENHPNENQSQ